MAAPATRLGDVLNDAYELQELVSSSGPVEVYRATDKRTRAAVRITLLRPEFALQGAVVENFLRRPRALSAVSHASLPLLRVDTDETGIPFVVEEVVEGRTLASLIDSFPQGLPFGMISQLYAPLVEALALAHRSGIVHGGIDDAHVRLLGPAHQQVPKLLGLGAPHSERGEQDAGYRAPELASADAPPTRQADVFALGVLLYKMLSGVLPFRSGKKSAVPLDEIAPNLPSAWVNLTLLCLQAKPSQRLPDAGALLVRLRACPEPEPKPEATRERAAKIVTIATPDLEATLLAPIVEPAQAPAARPPVLRGAAAASGAPAVKHESEAKQETRKAQTRKEAAAEAGAKLSAKVRPKPESYHAAPPIKFERPANDQTERPVGVAPSVRVPVSSLTPAVDTAPRPSGGAAQGRTSGPGPSAAQLAALRALDAQHEVTRERWLGALLLLLFLALLLFGVPFFYEPNLATARVIFGPRLRIVSSAFAVVAVIGAVRVWAAQVDQDSLIARVTSYLLHAVTGCILVLTATLYSASPALARLAGAMRVALPWGAGLLFFFFAARFAQRGVRRLVSDTAYGALALSMACGCLYGSYQGVLAALRKHKKPVAAAVLPSDPRREGGAAGSAPPSLRELRKRLTNSLAPSAQPDPQQDVNDTTQRDEVGANEEQDLKATHELQESRAKNTQALDQLGKRVPAPAEPNAPTPPPPAEP